MNKALEDILKRITTRTESGVHFTSLYSSEDLEAMESSGWIKINRPVHEPTGIQYDQQYWTLEVTEKGQEIASNDE
jgi:hypothetical protein